MATCPKCRANLGLQTSFALANFWSTPLYGGWFNQFRLAFPCRRCGTTLTYRYEPAVLFAVLALLPLMAQPVLPTFNLGPWAFVLWSLVFIVYWVALSAFFSY